LPVKFKELSKLIESAASLSNADLSRKLSNLLEKRIIDIQNRISRHEWKQRYMLRTEVEGDLAQHLVARYLSEGDAAFTNLEVGRRSLAESSQTDKEGRAYTTAEQFTLPPEVLPDSGLS